MQIFYIEKCMLTSDFLIIFSVSPISLFSKRLNTFRAFFMCAKLMHAENYLVSTEFDTSHKNPRLTQIVHPACFLKLMVIFY